MTGEAVIDDDLVELLRVLAHPVRLKLIFAVRDQELAVGQIESATGVGGVDEQPTPDRVAVQAQPGMVVHQGGQGGGQEIGGQVTAALQ